MKLRGACSLKAMTNLDSVLKSRDITWPPKVYIVKAMIFPVQFSSVTQSCPTLCDSIDCSTPWFSRSHVWTCKLDHIESWALKNGCFWIVLEKLLESLLDCKESKPVNPKGNQPWTLLEQLMLKLKVQYFGHLVRRMSHWKRPWCWERLKAKENGATENVMVR